MNEILTTTLFSSDSQEHRYPRGRARSSVEIMLSGSVVEAE